MSIPHPQPTPPSVSVLYWLLFKCTYVGNLQYFLEIQVAVTRVTLPMLVCTHLNVVFMLNPNIAMKICRLVARINFREMRDPKMWTFSTQKNWLFELHPPWNPPTNTPFLAHFATKSGPFIRFGVVHCTPTPWLRAWKFVFWFVFFFFLNLTNFSLALALDREGEIVLKTNTISYCPFHKKRLLIMTTIFSKDLNNLQKHLNIWQNSDSSCMADNKIQWFHPIYIENCLFHLYLISTQAVLLGNGTDWCLYMLSLYYVCIV